jgi:Domain of unknown function (DUF6460)
VNEPSLKRRLPFLKHPGRTLFRLLLASFAVGVVLTVFDIRPEELLRDLDDYAYRLFTATVDAVRWAIPYILIGAVIVAPIWLAATLWKAIRRR